MIFTERTIMVVNDSATINKPLILYRGDKNIELKITIAESQFKFRNNDASNVIETTDASYAQLVINTPYGSPIFSDVAATKNGAVIFVITEAMIDEIREVGAYEIQIRLLDDNKQSRASIPPVSNAIEIREPIAIEDGSAVDSNAVNVAKVNRALTTTSAPLEAFDSQGNYIKKTWGDGDPITDAALNKMEAGIDGVNKKIGNVRSQIKENEKKFKEQLENKANKSEIGTPLIANSISEMVDTTKVYVNTIDNNWYSYNGSEWVIGGLYNSQGIADKSITPEKTNFINVSQNIINPSNIKDGYELDFTWNSANINDYVTEPVKTAYQDAFEAKNGDVFFSNANGRCVWYNSNGIVSGNASFKPDSETGLFKVTVGGGVKVKFDAYTSEINANGGYWFVCKSPYSGVMQKYGIKILSDDLESNIFAKEEDLATVKKNVKSLLAPTLDATFFIPKKLYCLKGTENDKWLYKQNIILSKNYDELYLDNASPNGACRGINGDLRTQGADDIKIKSTKNNSVIYSQQYTRCVADYTTKSNPSTPKNIMVIGDSLSDAGYIPCDIKDQLVNKFGFNNFNFIGTKIDTLTIDGTNNEVTCANEGRGGYTIDDYLKDNDTKGRGTTFPNPFLSNGAVSIKNYMTRNGFEGDLDYLIVELGVNNIVAFNDEPAVIKEKMTRFISMVLSEYPNCRIFICGLLGISKINEIYDHIHHNSKVLNVNKEYELLCETDAFKNNCIYVDTNTFFDVEFAYPYSNFNYRGSSESKKKITDWLHPSKAGYYMVTDTIVSAFVYYM